MTSHTCQVFLAAQAGNLAVVKQLACVHPLALCSHVARILLPAPSFPSHFVPFPSHFVPISLALCFQLLMFCSHSPRACNTSEIGNKIHVGMSEIGNKIHVGMSEIGNKIHVGRHVGADLSIVRRDGSSCLFVSAKNGMSYNQTRSKFQANACGNYPTFFLQFQWKAESECLDWTDRASRCCSC
jgi:hypothetical protein